MSDTQILGDAHDITMLILESPLMLMTVQCFSEVTFDAIDQLIRRRLCKKSSECNIKKDWFLSLAGSFSEQRSFFLDSS